MLVLFALSYSTFVDAQWSGYINRKTDPENPYGFTATVSTFDGGSKLKLVCFKPDQFRLYLDDSISSATDISALSLSVDNLPSPGISLSRAGGSYVVTNRTPQFWNLIAQMAAGLTFKLRTGSGELHQYSLKGFSLSYLQSCDWLKSVKAYRRYLDRYQ